MQLMIYYRGHVLHAVEEMRSDLAIRVTIHNLTPKTLLFVSVAIEPTGFFLPAQSTLYWPVWSYGDDCEVDVWLEYE